MGPCGVGYLVESAARQPGATAASIPWLWATPPGDGGDDDVARW
jgi:hypothetical protein